METERPPAVAVKVALSIPVKTVTRVDTATTGSFEVSVTERVGPRHGSPRKSRGHP